MNAFSIFVAYTKLGDYMKKKVGILLRKDETYHLNKELVEWIEEYELIPVGIASDNFDDMIDITNLCDGIILQGGKEYTEIELEYVRYLYQKDIPTLGICLGMQMMAVSLNGCLGTLSNNLHQSKEYYVHSVEVLEHTKLYNIVKSKLIDVNSRHNDYVKYTSVTISGYALDGTIEAVEDENHKFFIGIQWHPETVKDINSIRLLQSFKDSL